MNKRTIFLLALLIASLTTYAQVVNVKVFEEPQLNTFPLVSFKNIAKVYIDSSDFEVVNIAANLFIKDIETVTNLKPSITKDSVLNNDYVVIIGTLGYNNLIDQLIYENKLDVKVIENKWESFLIATIDNPFPNVKKALLIVGSDRRATAYGVFTLSETIGVSPWYWWADVVPKKREQLFVESGIHIQNSPSVKYRGIFINDEGFGGLNVWAKKSFETEIGDIGPKTYAKVFELLLRLKANYCWPAMHECTKPFYYYPENPVVADNYAIVIGTSHCEQMHCNTMTEWDVNKQGAWNYNINKDNINSFWTDRIATTRNYENTYTLGMRGTEDIEMEGAENVADMVRITQQSIEEQRKILSQTTTKDIESIPQILCTYKEVLVTYQNGLNVPEDVTLLWADDNHGYTRQLCTPEEQERSGGSGVYYHLSLLGTPEGFLWLNTISPSLIAYEMTKAYNFGADRIWMFNVGDIKPHEKELTFALEMAWDINRWTPANASEFIKEWSAKTFGEETANEIADLMESYYTLAASGKPEHCYRIDYSLNELNTRLEKYRILSNKASKLKQRIPENLRSTYYELIEYPILGCQWMNERNLLARRSMIKATNGNNSALTDAQRAVYCHSQLDSITQFYNEVNADGKWNYIMNWHPFIRGTMPKIATSDMIEKAQSAPAPRLLKLENAKLKSPLKLENNILKNTGEQYNVEESSYYASFNWKSETRGKTNLWVFATIPTTYVPSLTVSLNDTLRTIILKHIGNIWHTQAAAPIWYKLGEYNIQKGKNELKLTLPDSLLNISKLYLGLFPPPNDGFKKQILADQFTSNSNGISSTIEVIPGLGLGNGVSIMPFTATPIDFKNLKDASYVEYTLPITKGKTQIDIRTLPTQRIHKERGVRYAVSIDQEKPLLFDIQAEEFTTEWQDNVLKGYASRTINYVTTNTKEISLRIYLLDPGLVIRDLIIK